MNDIRVEIKIKNNKLYKLIFAKFNSVNEFSKACGVSPGNIGDYLNFTSKPYSYKTGIRTWRASAQKIADYFQVFPEDIFDEDNYEKIKTNKTFCEVDSEKIGLYLANEQARLEGPNIVDETEELLKKNAIEEALESLTARERLLIELRFGLNGNYSHTLEETGKKLGITKERIRQAEAGILMKLNNERLLKLNSFKYG